MLAICDALILEVLNWGVHAIYVYWPWSSQVNLEAHLFALMYMVDYSKELVFVALYSQHCELQNLRGDWSFSHGAS